MPQEYPEIKNMTLEEVKTALREQDVIFSQLYLRFKELESSVTDGRKFINPIRNIKITVNKSYSTARRSGSSPEEAAIKAGISALKSATKFYPNVLIDGNLPSVIQNYIIEIIEADKINNASCCLENSSSS